MVIPRGLILEDKNDWKTVYEHVRKLGYLFKFSLTNLMVILSVVDGGSGVARELSYKMQLQCDSLWTTNWSFQISRQGTDWATADARLQSSYTKDSGLECVNGDGESHKDMQCVTSMEASHSH